MKTLEEYLADSVPTEDPRILEMGVLTFSMFAKALTKQYDMEVTKESVFAILYTLAGDQLVSKAMQAIIDNTSKGRIERAQQDEIVKKLLGDLHG